MVVKLLRRARRAETDGEPCRGALRKQEGDKREDGGGRRRLTGPGPSSSRPGRLAKPRFVQIRLAKA